MVLAGVLHKVKVVLLFIVGLVKRSLCCFRRRRKSSLDSTPLTTIGVVPNFDPSQDVESWNSWEDGCEKAPQTVQEHIEHYRRQATVRGKTPQQEIVHPDFFQDMEPEIRKPAKVLLKTRDDDSDVTSRLAFVPDTFVPNDGAELGAWEESEDRSRSWAEAEGWDAEGILREKRREEHKKRIMEKEHRRTALGSRIS